VFGQATSGVGGAPVDVAAPNAVAAYAPSYARVVPAAPVRTAGPASKAPAGTAPAAAVSQPERATFLKGAVQRFGALFSRARLTRNVDNPSLHQIEKDRARLAQLDAAEPELLAGASKSLTDETARLTKALRATGLNPKTVVERVMPGTGGPLIPLGASSPASADPGFNNGLTTALDSLRQLSDVVTALNTIPLAEPLVGGEVSSHFGARIDPFNENLAFHAGMDFSAPKNTDVFVTAPGVVVFAGRNGAYGNSVEVDHGYGVRTRYGHLASIVTTLGARVDRGAVIGKLGSTGRSTGPHVHYEIWYDQAVRNPANFIKAGRYVLQE
jgi:murein DD-endopeptidase MepM/ murein hydrolase activator NlpD